MLSGLLLFFDIILLSFSIFLSTYFTSFSPVNIFSYYTGPTVFTIIFTLLSLYTFNLYESSRFKSTGEMILRVTTEIVFANLFLGFLFYSTF